MANNQEYDDGYRYGAGYTHDQARGARDAERDRQQKNQEFRDQMDTLQRQRSEDIARQQRNQTTYQPNRNTGNYHSPDRSQNQPATFAGTVKSMIWLGVIIAVGYAYFSLNLKSWPDITALAIQGALIGVALGVALYVAIVVLRWVITVAAVIIQFAFSCCIFIGGLYLLSKFF
jgi:hypothetical protein